MKVDSPHLDEIDWNRVSEREFYAILNYTVRVNRAIKSARIAGKIQRMRLQEIMREINEEIK